MRALSLPKYTGTSSFTRFVWVACSGEWGLRAAIPYWPSPPTIEEIKRRFIEDGQLNKALGEFVRKMLEGGYTVTILGYNVEVSIELVRKFTAYPFNYCVWRTWVTLTVDFTSKPEITVKAPAAAWLIIAIAAAIAIILAGVGAYYALRNLTTRETKTVKYSWVHNPATCHYEWLPVEESSEKGPPEWWSYVTGLIVVTVALGATLIIYEFVKGFRRG